MNLQTKLEEMRTRCEAASPGPWQVDQPYGTEMRSVNQTLTMEDGTTFADMDWVIGHMQVSNSPKYREDAAFIAAARSDMPALISALEVALGAIHEAKLWCDVGAVEKGEDYTLGERLDEAIEKAEALLLGEGKNE